MEVRAGVSKNGTKLGVGGTGDVDGEWGEALRLKEPRAAWFAGKSLSVLESKFSSLVALGNMGLSFCFFKMGM